jgi:hypothetical protein
MMHKTSRYTSGHQSKNCASGMNENEAVLFRMPHRWLRMASAPTCRSTQLESGDPAMKTRTLLIAVSLASSTALAQMPSPSQGAESQSNPQSDSGSNTSGAPAGQSSSAAGSEPSPLSALKPKTENGVTYLCGGVGEEEASYLKREARNHDMMLTFATRRGAYLADVNVDIRNARGQSVLQTNCDGPIMLVDLPQGGTYRVRADANGYTLNQTVNVQHGKGSHKVAATVLSWPERVAGGPASSSTQSGASGTSGNRGTSAGGADHRDSNSTR